MSTVLALDTSDRTAGTAVVVDGELRAEVVAATPARHSQRLLLLVEAALSGAGVSRAAVDCIAVTRGPGSFTGLRVGLSTAQGLAYALGLPMAGVVSLQALARRAAPFPGVVVPVFDAKKGQVYGAVYDGATEACLVPPGAWAARDLAESLERLARPCLFLGSGVAPYRGVLADVLGPNYLETPPSRWHVSPAQVALLGQKELANGRVVPAGRLLPLYLRRSEAEERRDQTRPACA